MRAKIRTEIQDERDTKLNMLIAGGFFKNKTEAVNAAIDMLFLHHLVEENKRTAAEQAAMYDENMLVMQGWHK